MREEPRGQRKETTGLPTAEGRDRGGEKQGLNGNGGLVVMEKEAGSSGSTLSIRERGITEAGCVYAHNRFETTLNSAQSRGRGRGVKTTG